MPRMKDCPECIYGYIAPEDWDPKYGDYPDVTPREAKREHSYCGIRVGGGAHGLRLKLKRRHGKLGYAFNLIHNGRKSIR